MVDGVISFCYLEDLENFQIRSPLFSVFLFDLSTLFMHSIYRPQVLDSSDEDEDGHDEVSAFYRCFKTILLSLSSYKLI